MCRGFFNASVYNAGVMETKLIILRGPSAAGKSTIAAEIRKRCQGIDIALVDQDYFKLTVLEGTSRDRRREAVSQMLLQNSLIALRCGYHVIMEGLINADHYRPMFDELFAQHPKDNYIYFFDISFEETLKRHSGRSKQEEFGEEEMGSWYADVKPLNIEGEVIFKDDMGMEEIVEKILTDTGLKA